MSDWRQGGLVYQIFVDRFFRGTKSPPLSLVAPRRLRDWSEQPKQGSYVEEAGAWSHELEFWGGDLNGVREKLDYLAELGVRIIYLTPIFESLTNHRYDTIDYYRIDPVLGTDEDLCSLCDEAHERGMRVVLDGVFNHMGWQSHWFREKPDFFETGSEFKHGYRAWKGVRNLPELALERDCVQEAVFGASDSVVRHWLKWIDGWRLDVAHDLGPSILSKLTEAAHETRSDSLVIGETWNYPFVWAGQSMDAVINFFTRDLILSLFDGTLSARQFSEAGTKMLQDCGQETIRRCWLVLDNHDTARLATIIPDIKKRQLARFLQFTLPGCPQLYYGDEFELTGGREPECRGPMPWSQVSADSWMSRLLALYRTEPALRDGDCRFLLSEKMLGFLRDAARFEEARLVIVNPTSSEVEETIVIPDHRLSHHAWAEDLLSGALYQFTTASLRLRLAPYQGVVLKPLAREGEYWPYRRI